MVLKEAQLDRTVVLVVVLQTMIAVQVETVLLIKDSMEEITLVMMVKLVQVVVALVKLVKMVMVFLVLVPEVQVVLAQPQQ